MARMRKTARKPRRKAVKVQLIPRPERKPRTPDPECPYGYIDKMIDHHPHLSEAKIAAAWLLDVKADKYGIMILGSTKKQTDLDRELRDFDLIMRINSTTWKHFNEKQRAATIDHFLCEVGLTIDKNGDPTLDERGRRCYHRKKPPIVEFPDVIRRHGLYTYSLQEFAKACEEAPLFKNLPEPTFPAPDINKQDVPDDEADPANKNGKINGHAHANADEAWKTVPIREALPDMPKKFYELVEGQDIDTIGKLVDWKNERPNRWWKDLGKGVGPATFDKLDDGIAEFFAKHPVEA